MKKYEIFAIIKEANKIEDELKTVKEGSPEYANLVEALSYTLDPLAYPPSYQRYWFLHHSKRTGHWYVTFE